MRKRGVWSLVLSSLVLFGGAMRCEAGFVDFFGNFNGIAPINVADTIAAGQTLDVAFSGTSNDGLSTVSGTVEFSNNAAGTAGSIALKNVTFQVTSGSSALLPGETFGLGAITNFAYTGSSPITGTNSAGGTFTFTGPNQIATMASGGSVAGQNIPSESPGQISNASGPYPQVANFNPATNVVTGIAATSSVQINYSISTSLSITTRGSASGAGPTTTFTDTATSLGYSPNVVPEPASLVLMGLGLAGIFALGRSRSLGGHSPAP